MQWWPKCQETWQKYRLLISSPCQNLVGWKLTPMVVSKSANDCLERLVSEMTCLCVNINVKWDVKLYSLTHCENFSSRLHQLQLPPNLTARRSKKCPNMSLSPKEPGGTESVQKGVSLLRDTYAIRIIRSVGRLNSSCRLWQLAASTLKSGWIMNHWGRGTRSTSPEGCLGHLRCGISSVIDTTYVHGSHHLIKFTPVTSSAFLPTPFPPVPCNFL